MKRILITIAVVLSTFMPAAASFADLSTDSNLSSEMAEEESQAQEEVQEVDSDMSLPGGGA
jgi:hypothetical protein